MTERDIRTASSDQDGRAVTSAPGTLAAVERDRIAQVLDECGGNKKEAAQRLGLHRRSLYRRLERYGLCG